MTLPAGVELVDAPDRTAKYATQQLSVLLHGERIGEVWTIGNGRDGWFAGEYVGKGINRFLRRDVGGYGKFSTPEAAVVGWLAAREAAAAKRAKEKAEEADRRKRGIIHVERPPLPWHEKRDARAWCNAPPGRHWAARVSDVGEGDRHRICKVCAGIATANARKTWENDPVGMLALWTPYESNRRLPIASQLLALAQLAAEHPERFRELADAELAMALLMQAPPPPKKARR